MPADAESLNELANELKGQGRYAEAEGAYRNAINGAPEWAVPWFNLGLMYKVQQRWRDSADCNRRAVELDPSDEGAWWNLGIAATACRDWKEARRAWRGCGLEIPDGEDPPNMNWGSVALRLNADDDGEVVWGTRLDPARAVVTSIPLPGSDFFEGDTVLHDGERKGTRTVGAREYSVFDVFHALERSGRKTHETHVEAESETDIAALEHLAADNGCVVEDWTASVRNICRACSEGVAHTEHEHTPVLWQSRRRVGVSAASIEQASAVLMLWVAGDATRRLIEIQPARER